MELPQLRQEDMGLKLQGDVLTMMLPFPPDSQYGTAFVLWEAYLAFFDGQRIQSRYAWKRWLNTLIGYFTHGFTHCEIAFRWLSADLQYEIWMTCNVYSGENLQFEFKTNDYMKAKETSLWSLYALELSKTQLNKLMCDCAEDVKRGLAFNTAVYTNFLLPHYCRYDGGLRRVTFCSEHVSTALKRIKCRGFEDIIPCVMDPLTLYNYVRSSGLFKRMQIDRGVLHEIKEKGGLEVV
jgi:hypothetical protein